MPRRLVESRQRINAREAECHNDLFEVERRPCRFGGSRPYVRCPRCAHWRLHIYADDWDWFACRVCLGLKFATQSERPLERDLRAVRKIRARLGASMNCTERILFKPKHMRQATFDRLRLIAERRYLRAAGATLSRLLSLRTTTDQRAPRKAPSRARGYWAT